MYRPLPECLTIKESEIEGLGLFATQDIPEGRILGTSHYRETRRNVENGWIRTPLGGFYNHSDNPNSMTFVGFLENEDWDIPDLMILKTLRDIKAGEEITVKYTLYKIGE